MFPHVTFRWLHASQFWWVVFRLSWMTLCDQPNWRCICIATSSNRQILKANLFLQNILACRQWQKPTPRRFPIPITECYFPHAKVIHGCFHRNEIPGFSVAIALSGSVESRNTLFVMWKGPADLLIFRIFIKFRLENLWISLRSCALQSRQVIVPWGSWRCNIAPESPLRVLHMMQTYFHENTWITILKYHITNTSYSFRF